MCSNPLIIGIDFDNTLVCYNKSIFTLAKKFFAVSDELNTKSKIKEYITDSYGNLAWTKFQGELYGPGMQFAEPYENAVKTLSDLSSSGIKLLILSHRTKYPYAGQKYNLHEFAKNWIAENLKFNGKNILEDSSIFFFEEKKEKIKAIKDNACDFFLDDLTEIIRDSDFPERTEGILFDPYKKNTWFPSINNWEQLKYRIRKLS